MDLSLGSIRDYAAEDKQAHAAVGCCVGAVSAAAIDRLAPNASPLVRVAVAIIPAVAVGIAKEAYDARHSDHHDPDSRDAVACAAGGALGAVAVTLVLRF